MPYASHKEHIEWHVKTTSIGLSETKPAEHIRVCIDAIEEMAFRNTAKLQSHLPSRKAYHVIQFEVD